MTFLSKPCGCGPNDLCLHGIPAGDDTYPDISKMEYLGISRENLVNVKSNEKGELTKIEPSRTLELSIEECKVLYDLLLHEYIPYDNEIAHDILRRIRKFLDEHDMA